MDEENNELAREVTKLDNVDGRDLQAIQMRYCGKTSAEIAAATGYEESYVRRLFMKGERLAEHYQRFAEDVTAVVVQRIKGAAAQAVDRMIELSQDADSKPVAFKANEFLLMNSGHLKDTSLRSFFADKSYEEARNLVNGIFEELYGKVGFQTPQSWEKLIMKAAEINKKRNGEIKQIP